MSTTELCTGSTPVAVLDEAHLGEIRGAFGTISHGDVAPRLGWWPRLRTLLAILGPGLIVMVGDNDAGAFGTYTQAGQNYGTTLLWTLLLLVPVLYVNQEMVLRLGMVTGVGHARLILERFGRFWGTFSMIDLFLLNALTIVTEFIGISLALDYLGLPKELGVIAAAGIIIGAAGTGDFRRFERFSLLFVFGSLLLIPVLLWAHPPVVQLAHDLVVPQLPTEGALGEVMLLIIAIVGTTIAPWQLFFQQSYVVDKRITPRFMRYERADLWIGIVLVVVGAIAMMAFTAATFAGQPEFGNFQDAGAVAAPLASSQAEGGEGVLRCLWQPHSVGCVARADAGDAAGVAHERGADVGRRLAAERDRVSAAAVQRRGGAGALGQRTLAQSFYRRRYRCAGLAVDHSDDVSALS
jgi:natural resistance-associated macrophage protein